MSSLQLFTSLLWSFACIPAQSSCINGNGCSSDASCDIEFVDTAIYGCSGTWNTDGIDNAESLCSTGYHICASYTEAESLGLTKERCTDASLIPTNYFYATKQSSSGSLTCDDSGDDDVFGCASGSDRGWLYFGETDNPIVCGPFGATLSTLSAAEGAGWRFGWEPWGDSAEDYQHELSYIEHRHTQREVSEGRWEYTNQSIGGVLCCQGEEAIPSTTTVYTSTSTDVDITHTDIVLECDACGEDATCDVEFVADAIYGCGGVWQDAGMEHAESLCGDGYAVCRDGILAEQMGLTTEDCLQKPEMNHFYATSSRSNGFAVCTNYDYDNATAPLGYDDVFGCGSIPNGGTYQPDDCGSFDAALSWDSGRAYEYGWRLWDVDGSNELKAIRHLASNDTNSAIGGVMCCKQQEDEWEAWHISEEEMEQDHSCKESTGCTQTNSLVSCDVEFVPERVYGCGGEFTTPGIGYGDWMCRSGYSLCTSTELVTEYGLTREMCASYPKENHFYASLTSTHNGYICDNDSSAEIGVFGCGLDSQTNWMWTISEWTEEDIPVSCGPYTAALNKYHYAEEYGWNISAGGRGKERYFTTHSGWEYGGVLCCRNLDESIYEAEYQRQLTAFYTARTCEIVSLALTLIIIIISIVQFRRRNTKKRQLWRNQDRSRQILAVLPHLIYFISVLDLLWFIITIWLLVDDYEDVEQSMNCQIRFDGIIALQGIYKVLLFLYMIYKIEVTLGQSAHRYRRRVYSSLKIFTILYIVIGYGSLFVFPSFLQYQTFPSVIGGVDCYILLQPWILWVAGTMDAAFCVICLALFSFKLYKVVHRVGNNHGGELSRRSKALRSLIFKNAILSFIALSSTWIFYYVGFQNTNPLGWFAPLDFAINNLCIFLMFSHNQALFKKLCCGCFIWCGVECAKRNTNMMQSPELQLAATMSGSSQPTANSTATTPVPATPVDQDETEQTAI